MIPHQKGPMTGAICALVLGGVIPAPVWSESLHDTFASPGMALVVRFDQCDQHPDTTCGTFVWGWDGEEGLALPIGTVIAPDLRKTETGWQGQLTDPASGRTFRGTLVKESGNSLLLRGCAGPFCTTERWYALSHIEHVIKRLKRQSR